MEPIYIQDLLFDEMRRYICYICKKSIRIEEGITVGKGLWRHKKCKPFNIKRMNKKGA
ncbi:MAG: hypothetical protein N2745_08800 [Syntrophorhabdaceae bacterium]|nr:hypothetical protein [Syntrophorhabdaceae bacterium]